jgi:hypothetical protein
MDDLIDRLHVIHLRQLLPDARCQIHDGSKISRLEREVGIGFLLFLFFIKLLELAKRSAPAAAATPAPTSPGG